MWPRTKLHFQNTTVLYNYDKIYNDLICINLILNKKTKLHPKHILYSTFCRWILSPSCFNQSYLNAPKGIITTFQLVHLNFPGGFERANSCVLYTASACLDTEMLKSTSSQTVFSHTRSTHSNRRLAWGHDSEKKRHLELFHSTK